MTNPVNDSVRVTARLVGIGRTAAPATPAALRARAAAMLRQRIAELLGRRNVSTLAKGTDDGQRRA